MIDLIYKHPSVFSAVAAVCDRGRALYDYATESDASRAVRRRRDYFARLLMDISDGGRALSVGCGHMRELAAVPTSRKLRVVALDMDQRSLECVQAAHSSGRVTTVRESVRGIVKGWTPRGAFDLVYAAGLFDYLNDRVATQVMSRLFDFVKPGGCVVVANFADTLTTRGYMESYMDWWLIYRNRFRMESLAGGLEPNAASDVCVESDAEGHVLYLRAVKRGLA
jgi:cyclopropane fatty-acyl-phospholipid synthase-like methyltransferase